MSDKLSNSYSQILKSSSIIGGAKVINYLCSMLRVKLVAVLLGPTGVGLVGLYLSATSMVGIISSLGIASSGGREVARDYASGDAAAVARTIKVLRRSCWVTGFFGWILTVALSWPLSLWVFGSGERTLAIALLGVTLLFKAVSDGQSALIGGMRRMGDLARIDVVSVVLSTVVAVALYAWLREAGIVPVIIATAAIGLFSSWLHARRIPVEDLEIDWKETFLHAKRFLGLGSAFVWSALMGAVVSLVIRSQIVRELGLDANGIFQAVSGLSILFASFVLGAMAADFYPRLSAIADDSPQLNRLVNEQTEVGILLVLPGLMGTLAYAPWVMQLFYSSKFISGAPLLSWLVIGVLGRIVSWPMAFSLLAKGESSWYAFTETFFGLLHLGIAIFLLHINGLAGVSISYPLIYVLYSLGMLGLLFRLTGFRWTAGVLRLLLVSSTFVLAGFLGNLWLPFPYSEGLGTVLTGISALYCIRGTADRLGPENRLVKIICRLPCGRMACGM